jgi:hypothetical protein
MLNRLELYIWKKIAIEMYLHTRENFVIVKSLYKINLDYSWKHKEDFID